MSTEDLLKMHAELNAKISNLNVQQMALKVAGNCGFGAMASQYFIFFDNRISEGITLTGQYIIKTIGEKLSDYISSVTKEKKDYNCYSDTDSVYLCLNDIVEKYFSNIKDENIIANTLDKFIKQKLDKVIVDELDVIADKLNVKKNTFGIKREAISSAAFWCGKKRYAQRVLDNEGVRYSEPEYKVTGIETNRSSTPDLIREWLMDAIKLILNNCTQEELVKYVEKRRVEFLLYPIEAISFPRSANNLKQYSDKDTIFTKGCPIAVRAALLYNHLLKKYGLSKDLESIKEGNKILYCALKEPNPLRSNIIGFPSVLPEEFGLHKYIDYETQFEKAFLAPLTKITDRDRLVSATVVQWLGTNCGLCFLRETLEEAGYKIVKK